MMDMFYYVTKDDQTNKLCLCTRPVRSQVSSADLVS